MPTANLTITIDNASQVVLDDIIDTVSESLGWIEDPGNLGFDGDGRTKGQFVEQRLIAFLKIEYKKHKQRSLSVDTTDFDSSVTQS